VSGVLVTGGTGKTGGALAELLRRRDVVVRVGSRHPAPGRPDAVRFDWDDATTYAPALHGTDRVYLVPPPSAIDPLPVVGPFLAEAERAGVRRVVLLGSAVEFPDAPGRLELEDEVRRRPGGIVLRPSGFMQNFLRPHPTALGIRDRGEIRTSAGSGRLGWIDVRDVAAAAAAVLGDPAREVDGDQVLTGPEALSYADAAEVIAAGTGRPVRVVDVAVDEVAAHFRELGVPASFADMLAGAEIGVGKGDADRVTTAVADLTGRPPRSFADFVREHVDEWAAPAT
jgi:uncharacterized protein YbjT (DUF2867 family)